MKTKIKVKPLSINKCFQGRRFKTPAYTAYEREVWYLLPKIKPPEGVLAVYLEFGFSSTQADIDNPIKNILDILQKKYQFNDRQIASLHVIKKLVKKKKEYIIFEIKTQ